MFCVMILFVAFILISFSVFLVFSSENSITLMKACWNELFALGLAQCSHIMNVETILTAIINHLQTSLDEGMLLFLNIINS